MGELLPFCEKLAPRGDDPQIFKRFECVRPHHGPKVTLRDESKSCLQVAILLSTMLQTKFNLF
jgi:hypothetical protein